MRFIQVSCLGASPTSESRMRKAKAAAEEAILRELPEVSPFCVFSKSLLYIFGVYCLVVYAILW